MLQSDFLVKRHGFCCKYTKPKSLVMKNSKKIGLFFAFLILLDFSSSCCRKYGNVLDYTNCQIAVENLDNSGADPVVIQTADVPKEAYGIRLNLTRSVGTCQLDNYQSFLFSSAYACKDNSNVTEYRPLEGISAIKIITLNDFDTTHQANNDVTSYFYLLEKDGFISVYDYLSGQDFIYYDTSAMSLKLDLFLMTTPTQSTQHQFRVEVYLTDGRILTAETPTVNLI